MVLEEVEEITKVVEDVLQRNSQRMEKVEGNQDGRCRDKTESLWI